MSNAAVTVLPTKLLCILTVSEGDCKVSRWRRSKLDELPVLTLSLQDTGAAMRILCRFDIGVSSLLASVS